MPIVSSPACAIRKRPEVVFTLPEYVDQRIMTEHQADVIREAATASFGFGGTNATLVLRRADA